MAQTQTPNKTQGNPKLRQRLQREHHLEHKEERLQKERERFTQAPTGPQARHQAHAYAGQEYNPTIRGIREEAAKSRVQQEKGVQWYNQLGSELAGAAQQEEAGAAALGNTLTAQLAQANATNAATLAKQEAANAQFAQTTGMQGATGQAAAAGNAQSALTGVALNAPLEANAQNQAAYTRRLGLVQKEQGHEYEQGQIGARKKIMEDLRAAQKQKGQAYVGRLAEERESARKQELDAKAFELEGQQTALQAQQEAEKLAAAEAQSKRSAATSRQNSQRTAASSAASTAASTTSAEASAKNAEIAEKKFQAEQRYKRNHGGRTPAEVAALQKERQPSTSERNSHKEDVQNGWAAARSAIKALGKNPATYTAAEWLALEQHLTAPKTGREPGAGIDPAVAAKVVAKLKAQAEANAPATKAAENFVKGAP
jgi:hypothetical protein